MGKKKNKTVLRPWCWYCEREFEDEKVLMQHQKAKHYKCKHCPRKLNTAGGLAVHVQQVHKLDPDKIENALPGRDGGEVEIFGMEGVPKTDLEDWKRRKEQELGLAAGTISQPLAKRPRLDLKPLSEADLRAQLAAHVALMSGSELPQTSGSSGPGNSTVVGAPQTYVHAAPPPFAGGLPPGVGFPPGFPPPGIGAPPFPPGGPPFPGAPMPGFPPGPFPPGAPPFAPNGPPLHLGGPPPPGGMPFPPPGLQMPAGGPPPFPPQLSTPVTPAATLGQAGATSSASTPLGRATSETPAPTIPPRPVVPTPKPIEPNPALKEGTKLIWDDYELSPLEKRAQDPKYSATGASADMSGDSSATNSRKRARAEDFI